MTTTLEAITVTLDSGDEVRDIVIDALHDPTDHWNGFVVPFVTREDVDRIFAWGTDLEWSYSDDGTLTMIDYPGTNDESQTTITPVDGRYRLDIGWTFMPVVG